MPLLACASCAQVVGAADAQMLTACTAEELQIFYAGYEDAYADEGAQVTDVTALDRPLAAMYQKGLGKGKGRKGKKGQGGKSKSAEEKAQIPCRFFAKGNCSKGEQCEYMHDS